MNQNLEQNASTREMDTQVDEDGISPEDGLLDKRRMAAYLNVSTRTLDVWLRARRIPFFKIGRTVRFRLDDVLAHLNRSFRVAGQ